MGAWNSIRAACRFAFNKPLSIRCQRLAVGFGGKATTTACLCGMVATLLAASGHAARSDGLYVGTAITPAGATAPKVDPLRVAVAANFRAPLQELAGVFEQVHGVHLSLTFGSSGLLAAQIRQGAPFDAFFSADRLRPQALIGDGLAAAPVTVYAQGRVALRIPGPDSDARGAGARRIGIPNPELAPYGAAAVQCLQRLGVWRRFQPRLVYGNNVNQVDHFLASGALHWGFVALSQLVAKNIAPERYWVCPSAFHAPIDQGAVVLLRSRNRSAAGQLLRFMAQPATQARLQQLGYAGSD